jgi:hypothetical protein
MRNSSPGSKLCSDQRVHQVARCAESSAGRVRRVEGGRRVVLCKKGALSEESSGKGCAGRVCQVLCEKSPHVNSNRVNNVLSGEQCPMNNARVNSIP